MVCVNLGQPLLRESSAVKVASGVIDTEMWFSRAVGWIFRNVAVLGIKNRAVMGKIHPGGIINRLLIAVQFGLTERRVTEPNIPSTRIIELFSVIVHSPMSGND